MQIGMHVSRRGGLEILHHPMRAIPIILARPPQRFQFVADDRRRDRIIETFAETLIVGHLTHGTVQCRSRSLYREYCIAPL